MDKTKLLVLLILAVMFVNYTNYIQVDREKLVKNIQMIESRIAREQKTGEIYRASPEDFLSNENNLSALFFPKETEKSLSMADIGQQLKTAAKKHSIHVLKLTWGEPYANEDDWYAVLPFSMQLRAYPSDFRLFYNDLKSSGRLVSVSTLKATRDNKRKIVEYNLNIAGFKLRNMTDDQK